MGIPVRWVLEAVQIGTLERSKSLWASSLTKIMPFQVACPEVPMLNSSLKKPWMSLYRIGGDISSKNLYVLSSLQQLDERGLRRGWGRRDVCYS